MSTKWQVWPELAARLCRAPPQWTLCGQGPVRRGSQELLTLGGGGWTTSSQAAKSETQPLIGNQEFKTFFQIIKFDFLIITILKSWFLFQVNFIEQVIDHLRVFSSMQYMSFNLWGSASSCVKHHTVLSQADVGNR